MERQAKMLTYMKDMNYFTATRLKPESQQFIYTNIYDMIYTVVLVSQCSTDLLKRCASNINISNVVQTRGIQSVTNKYSGPSLG